MLRAPRGRSETGQDEFHRSASSPRWTATASWRGLLARRSTGRLARNNAITRPVMEKPSPASTARRSCRNFTPHLRRVRIAPIRSAPIESAPAFGKRKAALYRHLLRQLQQARDRHGRARGAQSHRRRDAALPIPAAAACRSWNRRSSTASPRNAAKVSKELVQADRRGLRHRRAHRLLRADAEIRMAADRCPTMKT